MVSVSVRPPTPASYQTYDERFLALIEPEAMLHHLAGGCTWAEGPVYLPTRDELWWSDVRQNRRLCYTPADGSVVVLDQPANFCNGHTLDLDDRVLACEHGTRSVVRFEVDGSLTVIADRFDGKRLNSPNDVVVASDGAVWFTDPTYGIDSDAEGYPADSEIGSSNVYRVDPASGSVAAMITDMVRPNGLAFSLDESSLYVVDTGWTHVTDGPRNIRRYDVCDGAVVGVGELWATCPVGLFDGLRLDEAGRIWTSGGEGVYCYDPDGTLLGTVVLPEPCANVVFGGAGRRTLYMTATTSLYALVLRVSGAGSGTNRFG